jgi:hypothetical protein
MGCWRFSRPASGGTHVFALCQTQETVFIVVYGKAHIRRLMGTRDPWTNTDIYVTQRWYDADGNLHRDGDLPAVVRADGRQEWYHHGRLHRGLDLPAVVWPNNKLEWWQNGRRHRDGDQPAMVLPNGVDDILAPPSWNSKAMFWFRDGKLHRGGGLPAVVWEDGRHEWWVDGVLQCILGREKIFCRWSPLRAAWVGAVAAAPA